MMHLQIATLVALGLLLAGCGSNPPDAGGKIPELRPGVLAGYLQPAELPNSFGFLPPPPAAGSAEMLADEAANQRALAMQGSDRFRQAAADVDLQFPNAARHFQCALGSIVSDADTPALYRLLRRSMVDAGLSTYSAKNQYQRARPFMVNGQPSCTPETEEALRQDGSYPSGHAALGWAWGLILSVMEPERATAILARGFEFGESRAVCNVHWQSDVNMGRLAGSAAVARLFANETFRSDFDQATGELKAARMRGLGPEVPCTED